MEERCRVTPGEGDLRESATESRPPAFFVPATIAAKSLKDQAALDSRSAKAGKGERVG